MPPSILFQASFPDEAVWGASLAAYNCQTGTDAHTGYPGNRATFLAGPLGQGESRGHQTSMIAGTGLHRSCTPPPGSPGSPVALIQILSYPAVLCGHLQDP